VKAVLLEAFGSSLTLSTVPDPELGTGEVIVDVAATRVLPYAREVLRGARPTVMELPAIPGAGAIGRVRATGPDATKLATGDWVFCDPTVRSRDDALAPDIVLQGLTAAGPGGQRLQKYFRHGSWAQRMRVPTENAISIGPIDAAEAMRWCALGILLVPYGGFLAADLRAGETLVLNGATGSFGSAGVAVALAMGVRAVIATGRNESALAGLAARFGSRVTTVPMRGEEQVERERILAAAPAPIDCVLDLLPPAATAAQVRAAVLTVRPNGRVVLMGGVGSTGGGELALPYSWLLRNNITVRGQWMYPHDAVFRMVAMIRSGLIDLEHFAITSFGLARIDEAVDHAAENATPFLMTVLNLLE
jgi:alcohol dehydrogenase